MPRAASKIQHSQIGFFFLKASTVHTCCPVAHVSPPTGSHDHSLDHTVYIPLGERAHNSSPVPGHSGCCQSSAIVNESCSVRLSPRDRNPGRRGLAPGPRTAPPDPLTPERKARACAHQSRPPPAGLCTPSSHQATANPAPHLWPLPGPRPAAASHLAPLNSKESERWGAPAQQTPSIQAVLIRPAWSSPQWW